MTIQTLTIEQAQAAVNSGINLVLVYDYKRNVAVFIHESDTEEYKKNTSNYSVTYLHTKHDAYFNHMQTDKSLTVQGYLSKAFDNLTYAEVPNETKAFDPEEWDKNKSIDKKKTGYGAKNHDPAFFAKGTLVSQGGLLLNNKAKVFEVKSVIKTGPDDYLIETTLPAYLVYKHINSSEDGEMYTFNVTLVDKIIKRGEGKVTYKKEYQLTNHQKHPFEVVGKNWVCVYRLSTLVESLVHRFDVPVGALFDCEQFSQLLAKQTFVKYKTFSYFNKTTNFYDSYTVDKKRTLKFMKANFNRFLVSAKKEQELIDERNNQSDDLLYPCDEYEFI
jgi:hypothetical protein